MKEFTLEVATDTGYYFEIDIRAETFVYAQVAAKFMFPKARVINVVEKQS